MSPSRHALSSLTLAVGLGVAVTTSQGIARAETGDPPSPSSEPAASSTNDSVGTPDASPPKHVPGTKRKPRPLFDGPRIVVGQRGSDASTVADSDSDPAPESVVPVGHSRTANTTDSNGPADPPPRLRPAHPLIADRPRIPSTVVPDRSAVSVAPMRSPLLRPAAFATAPVPTAPVPTSTVVPALRTSAVTPSSVVETQAPTAAAVSPPAPGRVIGGLLAALGLNPSTVNPGLPTLPLPRLIEMAFVAFRRTFFNQSPTAKPEVTVNPVDGTATGDINGMDRDGDKLTYTLGTPPAHGSVALASDGSFTYTPDPAWAHAGGGPEEFTVVISDASSAPHLHLFGGGHDTTATVQFTVPQLDNAPAVEIADRQSLGDGRIVYTVNVSDPDGDAVAVKATAVNGTVVGQKTSTTGGTDVYSYTFTPDPTYAHGLTLGGSTEPGSGSVTFAAADSLGATSTTGDTVMIAGVNAAPVVSVGQPQGNTVAITITDPDGDAVTVDPVTSHGTLTGTGTPGQYQYTFTVDADFAHDLTEGGLTQPGTAGVTFTATDGHGGSTPGAASITVNPANQAPVITLGPVVGNTVTATVSDADGDPVDLTPTSTHGTFAGSKTGTDAAGNDVYTYTFTPDADYAHGLTVGGSTQTGTGTIEFTATDGHGGSAQPESASFVVNGVNHNPVITVSEPQGNTVTVTVHDDDGDTVDLHPSSSNGTFTEVKGNTDASGNTVYTYTFTPDAAYAHGLTTGGSTQTGTGSITFAPTDGFGDSAPTTTAAFVVAGVNRAPVITTSPQQGNTVTITVTDQDGDDVTISPPVTSNGTLSGRTTVAPGVYQYTFTADPGYAHQLTAGGSTQTGTATVQFTADDGHGGSAPTTSSITVVGVNRAPVITTGPQQGNSVKITVTDLDGDDATITPSVTSNGTLSGRTTVAPGVFEYTFTADPNYAHGLTAGGSTQTGLAAVQFTASDDHGGQTSGSAGLTVVGQNQAPVVTPIGSTKMNSQSLSVTFTLKPTDPDSDPATILSVTAPSNPGTLKTVQNADGTWTVTYTANYDDVHGLGPTATRDLPLTVTMTDGHSAAPTTSTVNVTEIGLDRPPQATASDPVLTRSTGAVNGTVTWVDRDAGDTLSGYSATLSDPSKGTLQYDSATGKYTFTPNAAARAAASVAGAPLTDRRVLVNFTVSDPYGPVTETVPVVIAPPDNTFIGFYDSDKVLAREDDPNTVVVTPDGKQILVGNSASGLISLLDAQTGEEVGTYGVGDFRGLDSTKQMIYTPAGAAHPAAYVIATDNKLYQINTSDPQSEPISVQLPGVVQQVATSADGSTVYVSVTRTNPGGSPITQLYAVDAATMTVGTNPVTATQVPTGTMVLDPSSGDLIIALGEVGHGYAIYDPVANTVTRKALPGNLDDLAPASGGDMWAIQDGGINDNQVVHILTATGETEDATAVSGAKKIVLSPDGDRAYVLTSSTVVVLDTGKGVSNRQVAVIRLDQPGQTPPDTGTATDIAISPDGTRLYVTRVIHRGAGDIDRVSVFSISPSEAPPDPAGSTNL